MKYLVEVAESSFQNNTYLVEAESEDEARKEMLEGFGDKVLELKETFTETSEVTNVHSVKPYPEEK